MSGLVVVKRGAVAPAGEATSDVQSGGSPLDPGKARPKKSRNVAWLIVGLGLVIFSSVGAFLTALSFTDDAQVVVAARPLKADHLVEVDDLKVITVPARVGDVGIPGNDLKEYVGQRTTGPVGLNSVVHPDQFSEATSAGSTKVVVGLPLEAGQLPQLGLRQGQKVRLVKLSGDDFSTDPAAVSDSGEIGLADVVRVVELSGQDEFLASLRVSSEDASSIVDLGSKGRIALVLVGESETVVVEGTEPPPEEPEVEAAPVDESADEVDVAVEDSTEEPASEDEVAAAPPEGGDEG